MTDIRNFFGKLIFPTIMLCGLFATWQPFYKSLSLVLLALVLILSGEIFRFKVKWNQFLKWDNPILWTVALYLLYVLGMLWSSDWDYGLFDLQVKLPLLLVPFLMCFVPKGCLTRRRLWLYAFSFVVGLLIVLFSCLIRGIANGISDDGFNYRAIVDSNLTFEFHRTYLSMFCTIALIIAYKAPFVERFAMSQRASTIIKASLIVILNVFPLLMLSRASNFALVILNVALVVDMFAKRKPVKASLMFVFTVLIVYSIFNVKFISNRYEAMERRVEKNKEITEGKNKEGRLDIRTFFYTRSFKLIAQSPIFGCGTGDVKNVILDFTKKENNEFSHYVNPHNQPLQTAIGLGIVGLVCFVMIFFCLLKNFWANGDYVQCVGIIALGLYFIIESILESQAGVHCCAFAFLWLNVINQRGRKQKRLAKSKS